MQKVGFFRYKSWIYAICVILRGQCDSRYVTFYNKDVAVILNQYIIEAVALLSYYVALIDICRRFGTTGP